MNKKNDAGMLHDLMAAKAEAKEKMRELTDDRLSQVTGGACPDTYCPRCGALIIVYSRICPTCGRAAGDERDMNEELADISGLTEDLDGFVE